MFHVRDLLFDVLFWAHLTKESSWHRIGSGDAEL